MQKFSFEIFSVSDYLNNFNESIMKEYIKIERLNFLLQLIYIFRVNDICS